jgi:hypothetical protein
MYKNRIGMHVEKNAFVDSGNGLITFPRGQIITDNTQQRNGTKYDIETMDLSEYGGQVTADHVDMIQCVIGKVTGLAKGVSAVTIDGIQFAVKENALALLAYNLMVGGYPLDLSIETYGPWPDDSDETYYKAKLIGLSVVVVGNNKSASMNHADVRQLVHNSLAQAKQDGLDTSDAERVFEDPEELKKAENVAKSKEEAVQTEQPNKEQIMFKTIKNSRDFPVTVNYKNAAGDSMKVELAAGASVDVSEDQAAALETQINSAQAPQAETLTKEDLKGFLGEVKELVDNAVKPIADKVEAIEQNGFDAAAKVPEFKKDANGKQANGIADEDKEMAAMGWQERGVKQIQSAWNMLKGHDAEASLALRKLNAYNLKMLKEKGVVTNSLSLGDLGNFVISPELLSEIQGIRTNYAPLVNATTWKETLSTQMAWLSRSGDIDMQPVAFLDDNTSGAYPDGNLKPISTYETNLRTADLEELAAVTPVMNSATRFLAADILSDVAAGYRNDYDRKRAQLIIARLQQAVTENGNSVAYNVPTNVAGIEDFLDVWTKIGEKTPNGTYVLGTSSFSEVMKRALSAGPNGPLAGIFTTGKDNVQLLFNRPYIVVSDDLLPALNTTATKSFTVDGSAVSITNGVFYLDLANFTGRTSGGLSYDLSMEAAYEDGGVVKSSFQRNELVLRGSFFRGGAVLDEAQVAALSNVGVS